MKGAQKNIVICVSPDTKTNPVLIHVPLRLLRICFRTSARIASYCHQFLPVYMTVTDKMWPNVKIVHFNDLTLT